MNRWHEDAARVDLGQDGITASLVSTKPAQFIMTIAFFAGACVEEVVLIHLAIAFITLCFVIATSVFAGNTRVNDHLKAVFALNIDTHIISASLPQQCFSLLSLFSNVSLQIAKAVMGQQRITTGLYVGSHHVTTFLTHDFEICAGLIVLSMMLSL